MPLGSNDWLFEFDVTYGTAPARSWYFPIMVSASVPSVDRLEQAKSQLRGFVAAMSAEVQAF